MISYPKSKAAEKRKSARTNKSSSDQLRTPLPGAHKPLPKPSLSASEILMATALQSQRQEGRPSSAITSKHGEISDDRVLTELHALQTSSYAQSMSPAPMSARQCRSGSSMAACECVSPTGSNFDDEHYQTPPTVSRKERGWDDSDYRANLFDDGEERRKGGGGGAELRGCSLLSAKLQSDEAEQAGRDVSVRRSRKSVADVELTGAREEKRRAVRSYGRSRPCKRSRRSSGGGGEARADSTGWRKKGCGGLGEQEILVAVAAGEKEGSEEETMRLQQEASAGPFAPLALTGRLKNMHWGAREVEEWKEQTQKKIRYREELLEQMQQEKKTQRQGNGCRMLFAERADDEETSLSEAATDGGRATHSLLSAETERFEEEEAEEQGWGGRSETSASGQLRWVSEARGDAESRRFGCPRSEHKESSLAPHGLPHAVAGMQQEEVEASAGARMNRMITLSLPPPPFLRPAHALLPVSDQRVRRFSLPSHPSGLPQPLRPPQSLLVLLPLHLGDLAQTLEERRRRRRVVVHHLRELEEEGAGGGVLVQLRDLDLHPRDDLTELVHQPPLPLLPLLSPLLLTPLFTHDVAVSQVNELAKLLVLAQQRLVGVHELLHGAEEDELLAGVRGRATERKRHGRHLK
eukprot:400954-Hanusia_phi.AAC.1